MLAWGSVALSLYIESSDCARTTNGSMTAAIRNAVARCNLISVETILNMRIGSHVDRQFCVKCYFNRNGTGIRRVDRSADDQERGGVYFFNSCFIQGHLLPDFHGSSRYSNSLNRGRLDPDLGIAETRVNASDR